MSAQQSGPERRAMGSTRLFVIVWVWLVAITCFEVFLGYERLRPELLLGLLVGLSMIEATLFVSYFMHLRYERLSLTLLVIPGTLFCICMIVIFFLPDSWRLLQMRPH
jgi:cytochrome c oxidase subunit IV